VSPAAGRARRAPRAACEAGRLAGTWDGAVAVFRGIPFAAPPVGAGRWRAPVPAARWAGERRATEFGPAPVQPQPRRRSLMFQANFADRRALVMSEDCLYLNVWTPEPGPSAALPVLVWLHGGGNRFGYGAQDIHDGARLAARGLVVVTLNYRLGALGFLAHRELSGDSGSSGNWALLDVLAALRWVQSSIRAFGGDPGRVTLAGNSAGAAFVCHLMAAPAARGLFAGAIGQSSAGLSRPEGPMPTLAQGEAAGAELARALGGHTGLDALRELSAAELAVTGPFTPIVDGTLLSADTADVFGRGEQARVPLLTGSNTDEGSIYTGPGAAAALAGVAAGLPAGHPFHAAYPAAEPRSARLYTGETRFVWPVWRWAREHATAGVPVWLYRFGRPPPLPQDTDLAVPPDGGPVYGAFHSAELAYCWDNLAQRDWPWTAADHTLAAAMSGAWARFAAAADPGGGGLPGWPRLTAGPTAVDDPVVMHFADPVRAGPMDRLAAMRALDELRGAPAGSARA
jgi:para-nitrobenzyl esterase